MLFYMITHSIKAGHIPIASHFGPLKKLERPQYLFHLLRCTISPYISSCHKNHIPDLESAGAIQEGDSGECADVHRPEAEQHTQCAVVPRSLRKSDFSQFIIRRRLAVRPVSVIRLQIYRICYCSRTLIIAQTQLYLQLYLQSYYCSGFFKNLYG